MILSIVLFPSILLGHLSTGQFFESLSDGISSAKQYLKQGFDGLKTVADTLRSVEDFIDATIDEECEPFTCRKGFVPVHNPNHVAEVNGCGSYGFEWAKDRLPNENLQDCCHDHDLCYDQCGSDKDYCDLYFKKCLYDTCRRHNSNDPLAYKTCKAAAKVLYTATVALGCKPYKDAQAKACLCKQEASYYEEL